MKLFYLIHTFLINLVVLFDTIIFAILSIISGFFNPYSKMTTWSVRTWARVILWTSGVKLQVEGLENIELNKPHIYIINHMGMFDIPAILVAVPQTARFIAKKELFKIPLFSMGMRYAGMLPIDRGNSDEAKKTLQRATATIQNDKCSVLIFPEGTRSKSGLIENFKKGGFILASQGKIPIIPTVIEGSLNIVPKGSFLVKMGKMKIKFLDKVDTNNYTYETRNNLVKDVRNKMIDAFDPEFNR